MEVLIAGYCTDVPLLSTPCFIPLMSQCFLQVGAALPQEATFQWEKHGIHMTLLPHVLNWVWIIVLIALEHIKGIQIMGIASVTMINSATT